MTKIQIQLTADQHRKIAEWASREFRPVKSQIEWIIANGLEKQFPATPIQPPQIKTEADK